MFSFIKKYAATISGIDVYPKVALFLFLLVFITMIWVALKADKEYIKDVENIPLR